MTHAASEAIVHSELMMRWDDPWLTSVQGSRLKLVRVVLRRPRTLCVATRTPNSKLGPIQLCRLQWRGGAPCVISAQVYSGGAFRGVSFPSKLPRWT